MASHESAKKSVRKATRQRLVNQSRIGRIRTFIKKLEKLILNNSAADVLSSAFSSVQKEVMKGVTKGVLHKNSAARKMSRLSKKMKDRK
ncbi:MAG: 30S ribosomal protein S20 [Holosporales bacterium]|jgi:small subunit ribosomal protein S20|nr:30S ribosomal protein S20 [Holosporales bacterium]